ncbi:Putative Homeobox domain, HTH CenpB-type DNA-binding domain, Homeobox-like domain superfamily [Septoria linicola]|uniref:Homeobox domain, HTH CenpB-type DNA-binding domain, Homeobox-like domain superfamily n=1 Tax=Septoria linicola TaxID=215465 RepID=A0A9Q9EGX2_9PEZI|nr:Putative Homeobox domain, HTH CenpB-type DNA-binding domain, Homeobox-like domain superfamily [Septoria linicola]
MTTIAEEDEAQVVPVDFEQLLTDVTFGGTSDALTATGPLRLDQCPLHPDVDDCLCNGFVGNWGQVEEAAPTLAAVEEPDYSQFQNWIPRFVWPDKPCDYCRSKRLNCYVQRGEPHCTPCSTLFRECSLSKSQTLEATNYAYKDLGNFLDTLHVVHEDNAREFGTYTGIKPLRSKDTAGANSVAPVKDDAPGSSKRNGIRFPRQAVKILRDWLDAHADNPYPSEEEKAELERHTELKPSQIANWLANARRRRKVTEKSKPKLCMSPSLGPTTSAIPIPSTADKPWDELNPFERWQHSPPENEPADLDDIANALARNQAPADDVSTSPSTLARSKRRKGSSNGSGWSKSRAQSTTSQETGQTSSLSASSARYSNGSSHSTHGSFGSFSSSLAGKKDRRRRRRPALQTTSRKTTDDKKRIFQCTFCTDTFKSKYDWTRHEKSLHLSLEKWICAPLGPVLTDQESGNKKCVYCDLHNPSSDHLESHNHRQCEDKGLDARTFYRKDHLRQHLRLMHGCEMSPAMESWKSAAANMNSRCGFCAQRFTVWQERVDHLTAHFKAGARMSDWKGCRGLDPAVAAQVTNAMPPYLIGIESVSPNPFSATNRATWRELPGRAEVEAENGDNPLGRFGEDSGRHSEVVDAHCDGYGSTKATCWEIVTVRLGKYAKEMADKGVQMTDEMLQRQARIVLYDNDDTWNQTAADNIEWLDLFKKAHGLNFIPSAIGGQGSQIPEDLETYGDLGLRIPFAVQLQAYNQAQVGQQKIDAGTRPGPYKAAFEQNEANMVQIYALLSKEGVLNSGRKCNHVQCADNIIDISSIDESNAPGPATRSWCSVDLSTDLQQRVVLLQHSRTDETSRRHSNISRGLGSLFALDAREDAQASEARYKALEKMACMHAHQSCDDTGSRPAALGLGSFAKNDCAKRGQGQRVASIAAHASGLEALARIGCGIGHEQCNASCEQAIVASRARSRGLQALSHLEPQCNTTCEWEQSDNTLVAARARSRGLQALSNLEAPACSTPPPAKKPYLQRHLYELPKEKANMFATTTGAWLDSGLMPQTVDTSLPDINETTSTGAMMEFLGPSVGAALPFANDALTSRIPLEGLTTEEEVDWAMLNSGDITPEELGEFVNTAEQNVADVDMSWLNEEAMPETADGMDTSQDMNMDDLTFDDMIFDMPLDEAFGQ